jgi:threonine/homoserine/homoserine lactone efflux protein
MDLSLFLKGVALGFAIAAPVGPIGVLCIRKTVHFGRLSGFCSGIGAAAADAIYAIIAAFGLTFISDFLILNHFWLRLFGGAFLIYLGLRTCFSKGAISAPSPVTHKTLIADFLSTFFLTLTNPLTILSFFAVFAGLGLTQFPSGHVGPISLVGGVLIGSSLWWLMLSGSVSLFRHKISQRVMEWINIAAGISIIAFGLLAWSSLCLPFFVQVM